MQPEYLTRADIAAQYPISLSYLEKAKPEHGGPPIIRVGRKVLLKRTAFENWLDSHLADSTRSAQPQVPTTRRRGRPSKSERIAQRGSR